MKYIDTMKYILIWETDTHDFQEEIQRFLDDGWRLYGNLVITIEQSQALYYQAMIKDESKAIKLDSTIPDRPFIGS